MIFTNKFNLPQAFCSAVEHERHNRKGSFSATTLLKGDKEILLSERHYGEIIIDVSDSIWTIFGTAVHSIMEKQTDNGFKEEFFSVKVSDSLVTGRTDYYDLENETLWDWKTASVWKVKMKDFSDWYRQGMIYAWLMKKNGLSVKQCCFTAFLKDFSKTKAGIEKDYPESPVFEYKFDVTESELEKIERFIFDKIKSLEESQKKADDAIEPCDIEQRWGEPKKWACMKKGLKRALSLHDNEADARKKAESIEGGYVEERKGCNRKCERYCVCKDFCSFYKKSVYTNE